MDSRSDLSQTQGLEAMIYLVLVLDLTCFRGVADLDPKRE